MTIHYTASPPTTKILNIALYQIGPNAQEDFPAIAYHFMIDDVGDYHILHDLDRRVWHSGAPGANNTKVGICYIGNHTPNQMQLDGIKKAIQYSQNELGKTLSIEGHKYRYATSCPGPTWPGWKKEITP